MLVETHKIRYISFSYLLDSAFSNKRWYEILILSCGVCRIAVEVWEREERLKFIVFRRSFFWFFYFLNDFHSKIIKWGQKNFSFIAQGFLSYKGVVPK